MACPETQLQLHSEYDPEKLSRIVQKEEKYYIYANHETIELIEVLMLDIYLGEKICYAHIPARILEIKIEKLQDHS